MGLEPLLAAVLLGLLAVVVALRWTAGRSDGWRTDPPVSSHVGETALPPAERHPGDRHFSDPSDRHFSDP